MDPSKHDGPLGLVDSESITESIQNCHMSMEESRRRLMPLASLLDDEDGATDASYTDGHVVREFIHSIESTFASVDKLVICMADSGLITLDKNQHAICGGEESDAYILMASNCIFKAAEFAATYCTKLFDADSLESVGPVDDHPESEEDIEIQACMARLAEITLKMIHMRISLIPAHLKDHAANRKEDDGMVQNEIIDAYSEYQRRCLRSRSKPSITSVAELRRVASSQNCFVSDIVEQERTRQQIESGLHVSDEHGGEEDLLAVTGVGNLARGQPHAQCVTVILGEASSLIQPLAAWRDSVPLRSPTDGGVLESWLNQLCQNAMNILDNEAQTLAATVGSWFGHDQRSLKTLEQSPQPSLSESLDLVSMEAALDEMAFMCQVFSRYCLFSQQTVVREGANSDSKDTSKLHNLLTEQSLHYSSLETRLATLQFNQAISIAAADRVGQTFIESTEHC